MRNRNHSNLNLKGNIDVQNILDTCKYLNCHTEDVYSEGKDGLSTIVPGFKALAFDEGSKPYTIVSDTFGILQHYDVVKDTFDSLNKSGLNYRPVSFVVNDNNKRNSIKLSVLLPDLTFNVDGKEIFGCINVFNGNDSGLVYRREFAFYRMWCTNGMSVIDEELFFEKRKHTTNIEMLNLEEGFESLKLFHPRFASMLEQAQSVYLNDLLLKNFATAMKLSPLFMSRLPELSNHYTNMTPEMPEMNTLWGLYSVMTNYITNEVAPNNIARSANMSMLLYKVMKDIIKNREEFNARQITSEV